MNEQTTSYNGVQESYNDFVSVASGHVAGNMRIQNTPTVASAWTWVWDPIQQTTVRSGLFSAEFISSRNEQVSRNRGMNSSGLVAGTSTRYSGFSSLGEATWAWTPQRGSERIGLFQGQFVASGGITQSSIQRVLENGLIVGQSSRYVGAQGAGLGFWVWDQSTGQTSEIGIPITLPNGSVLPDIVHINDMGFVSGRTARVTQSGSSGGFVSWTWNPLTRSTVRTGLDAPEYYGSTGYYESRASVYGANGAVAGFSLRYPANGSQSLGQDAWYFDPMTNLVHKPTEGVPNIVRADGLANSFPVLLTEEGFLLGTYLVFLDNSFVSNAFIFRPDVGFADLGMIVDGGLSPQGWLSIQAPTFGATASVLAGIGVRFDQNLNDGSQHVYAMRRVPTAGTGMLALLSCGLMGSRRRRRPENAWLLRGSA